MKRGIAAVALVAVLGLTACTRGLVRKGAPIDRDSLPDLTRVMEAWVPVKSATLGPEYVTLLRESVVLPLRDLRAKGTIRWYAFLLHPCPDSLVPLTPLKACIQLWVERAPGVDFEAFRKLAPKQFLNVDGSGPSVIAGVDQSMLKNGDWTYAWKMIGESSEWIAELLISHDDKDISPQQVMQFLHYITNPLIIGGQLRPLTIGEPAP